MSKQTIIKGTLILTVAGIATKLLGFYNRIFLTRLIGVKELGVYQLIFPIYILAFSMCCQGIATTLTKQVSYYMGKKEETHAKKLFKYALLTSFILSLLAYLLINIFAHGISLYFLKNTDCTPLLKIISIAIPFISIKACINAYFVGLNMPGFQGISHFVEQIIRIGTAYILGVFWSAEKINASLAVVAVISGEIFATLLAIIFYLVTKHNRDKVSTEKQEKAHPKLIYANFLRDALPITSTNLILTMFSSLEAIILPAMLFKFYNNNDMALEMYGIITGIVIPFLLFPATITTSLSTMLLPAVSYASAQKNNRTIKKAIVSSLSFCFILGIATSIGYSLLGQWACEFAFNSSAAGIILRNMCFMCPFIYMSGTMSAMLNGLDKAFNNMILNVIGISIRILFTLTFVSSYGISAYITGMAISYILLIIGMGLIIYGSIPQKANK